MLLNKIWGPGPSPFLEGTQQFIQLDPTQPRQLLAGFDTIRRDLKLREFRLTKADLANHYDQFETTRYGVSNGPLFFVNGNRKTVGHYLKRNFDQIAPNDGDATSITFNDLFQRRSNLPANNFPAPPPPPPAPPVA